MDKRTILWRISHGLKWENKQPKLKRSIYREQKHQVKYILTYRVVTEQRERNISKKLQLH